MNNWPWLKAILSLEEAQYGHGLSVKVDSLLNSLASRLAARGIGSETPTCQIHALNKLVFSELRLRFRWEVPGRDFAVIPTLHDRAGNCLGLTTVYIALAKALSLPVQPLLFDGHIAAAFVGSEEPMHIEPSRAGAVLTVQIARRMRSGRVGRILSDEELLAVHLSNRAAFVMTPAGQLEQALGLIDASLTLFSDYQAAWVNKATLLLILNRQRDAIEAIERALNLNPGSETLATIGHMADQLSRIERKWVRSLIQARTGTREEN